MTSLILASIGVFLVVIILLVIILLVAKSYLSPSGEVTITMNGEQQLKHLRVVLCWVRCLPTMCSFHRLVVVRVHADSAVARCSKVVARFCLPKPVSSLVKNRPITGASDAR